MYVPSRVYLSCSWSQVSRVELSDSAPRLTSAAFFGLWLTRQDAPTQIGACCRRRRRMVSKAVEISWRCRGNVVTRSRETWVTVDLAGHPEVEGAGARCRLSGASRGRGSWGSLSTQWSIPTLVGGSCARSRELGLAIDSTMLSEVEGAGAHCRLSRASRL